MASMNHLLNDQIETFFIMTNYKYSFLSSSIVKEVAKFGGNISELVPRYAEEELLSKFSIK